jgi:transcriptional regulator with GAF, ATPase, and Fis domain
MNPRLIAISGSLKGTDFPQLADEVSIGRETVNTVCLNDPSVSRRHCVLRCLGHDSQGTAPEGECQQTQSTNSQWSVTDLESFNGTFVNGIPVKEQTLLHGDHLTVGDVVLLFVLHDLDAERGMVAAQLDEVDVITRSTVRLRREDAIYLHPDKVIAELPASERIARDLNTLLRISASVNSLRDSKELQTRLLDLIKEVVPAEREAILLVNTNQDGFSSACGWSKSTGYDNSLKVSATITKQVLLEGVALLSNDLIDNQSYKDAQSLVTGRICSVLCVPFVVFEKPIGVIYIDTTDPAARFDEGHLQLLTGVAGIAAVAIENARHFSTLEDENARLQKELQIEHEMIGESAPMRSVYQLIGKVAPTDSRVLIRGESGTGKELAAHAIHLNSPRAKKPFVAINCATLTESLLESELFGHEKGAFTGAINQKRGKLELADGGSMFLDEVGELTPSIQAKLLRVLQTGHFERLGGSRSITVDVRIIAATNRDLEEGIENGRFRKDLYYRLNVVSLMMPPLRDRKDDIALLANYFLAIYSRKCKRKVSGISPETRQTLMAYDWPGNVRELENAIERAVVLGSSSLLLPEDLPEVVLENDSLASLPLATFYESVKDYKRMIIHRALEKSAGNYTEAAKSLGVHPNNLHRMIRTLKLKEGDKA